MARTPTTIPRDLTRRPAILLGGDVTAVPVARSLGRAGVSIDALGGRNDPVRRSRHVDRYVDLGNGDDLMARWLDWLTTAAEPGSVVLPCADEGLELVARNRAALVEHGTPVPPTATIRTAEELRAAVERIGFPCALKPLYAYEFRKVFGKKGFVA